MINNNISTVSMIAVIWPTGTCRKRDTQQNTERADGHDVVKTGRGYY